jgi:glycosyltransferase involved in cell wall biosynthesis
MASSPLVSVVVPAYNSARYVARALQSILGQTYAPLEIIVVDDGSTDDTAGVLAPYRDRIRYFRQANRGPSAARNTGIRHARGELIAFLDADDWWLPEKLERQVPLLRERPKVGVVHSGFEYYDEATGRHLPSDHFHTVLAHELVGNCYVRLIDGNAINTCTAVVRRECFAQAGLFNESLGWMEDYDLWFRVARAYEFAFVPQALAVYRRHGTNTSSQPLRMFQAELAVSCRALVADPELSRAAGRERVHRKLFYLASAIGRHYLNAADLPRARRYFGLALRWCPPSRPAWDATWAVGRLYYEKDLFPEANRFFGRAVALRISRPYFWALWFATLLPFPVKNYWRALVNQWRAARFRTAGPHQPEPSARDDTPVPLAGASGLDEYKPEASARNDAPVPLASASGSSPQPVPAP